MATTTTDQEEELLIITDDSEESTDIELQIEEEVPSEEDVITFEESSDGEPVVDEKPAETKLKPNTDWEDVSKDDWEELNLDFDLDWEKLDLDFDLGGNGSEMTVEKMLGDDKNKEELSTENKEEKTDKNTEDDIFDFWLDDEKDEEISLNTNEEKSEEINEKIEENEEKEENDEIKIDLSDWTSMTGDENNTEEKSETISLNNDTEPKEDSLPEIASKWDDNSTSWDDGDDVNAILDATIAKLVKRKKQIEDAKEETIANIADLNEEIKGLQSEVKTHKSEVRSFDKETKKIDENVTNLEKMKMS